MKKHRKKIIIGTVFLVVLVGVFAITFSSRIADIYQKAVAQNDGEGNILVSSNDEVSEEETTIEANTNVLTLEDTNYAVVAGATSYKSLSSCTDDEIVSGSDFGIMSAADWQKLVELSQSSSLEGKTFYIDKNDGSTVWDLSTIISSGIGSESFPFAGTIKPLFEGMTIHTTVTLFDTLSSKSKIGLVAENPFTIENEVSNSTENAGGLAKHFIVEEESVDLGNNYFNLSITGTIQSTGIVGGLFGKVTTNLEAAPTITLSNDMGVNVSGINSLTGAIAGGLFGEVSGSINMDLVSMPSVAPKVTAAGVDYVNTETPLNLTLCAGGLIGKMSNGANLTRTVAETETAEYIVIGNEVGSEGISGGLVGAVDGSYVNVSYIQKDSVLNGTVEPYIYAKYICGGFIGVVQSSKVELSYLKLNSDVKAYSTDRVYTSAGGVVGKYITEASDWTSFLKISNITTGNTIRADYKNYNDYTQNIMVYAGANDTRKNTGGGIIGSCNGNQLSIHDINFSPYMGTGSDYADTEVYNVSLIFAVQKDFANINYVTNSSNESVTGGIAGSLCGLNLEISDIKFYFVCNTNGVDGKLSNSLGGNYVGDIAGLVGYDQDKNIATKMRVTDITVENNYIHKAKTYHGGLFGYVGRGAIICLNGTIDISKVPFSFQTNYAIRDYAASGCYMLAPEYYSGYRGFIAGYSEESLLYFEKDAEVTRSIKMEDGELVSNMEGVSFDSDNGTYHQYCIDDIGNAGSVFQNIESSENSENNVIDYSQSYGFEITQSLKKNTDEKYEISSLADALVLAIAGQAYDPTTGNLYFGANCFEGLATDGVVTVDAVLSASYLITMDLNLGEANIMSFLRGDSAFKFKGTMEGKAGSDNNYPVITLDSISKQINGGLYSSISGAIFKNLTIGGNLWYHKGTFDTTVAKSEGGSGSIAAKAEGSCTFEGIIVKTSIKGDLYSGLDEDSGVYNSTGMVTDRMYSHGGLIGTYQLVGGDTLSVSNCKFQSNITTIRSSNFVGGMVGRVDTSFGSDGTSIGSIKVSDSTLSATIIADATNYAIGLSASPKNKIHARTAGLIAFIGNSYANVSGVNNNYDGYPVKVVEDKTYAEISLSNLSIQNTTIDLSKADNVYVNMSGGLLGYAWCNVEATMDNIVVDGCNIQSLGSVGGLISFIAGKFDVNSVSLSNLTMNCVDGDRPFSGLLFGNGQVAYVTLKQDGYKINTSTGDDGAGTGIVISEYSSFDEIVGINVKLNLRVQDNATFFTQTIDETYANGGILNIINSDFSSFTSDSYESYTNKVCTTSNKYTRYYYNLFQDDEEWKLDETEFKNSITIDTPQELMIWHIGSYADKRLERFFVSYFNGDSSYRNKLIYVILASELDMNGYSLYPTCINNVKITTTNNAKIILYGEEISELEYGLYSNKSKIYRNNELKGAYTNVQSTEEYTQHYLMHSSLLYYVNNANISGLAISGSIANNGSNTGALIGGCAIGDITISNIVFDGLKVSHYASLSGEYSVCGLMLGNIGYKNYTDYASNVVIDNISTINYDSVTGPVAGALITRVGSSSAKNIQISFKNMNLDSESSSNVFKYAAFMYSFNYSSDTKDNKSYGIYTFDYADTVDKVASGNKGDNHNVTYGQEISEGIHYNDYYLYEIEKLGYANPLKDAIELAKNSDYVPYVYENMGIFVNPKNGNITKGCGTYEDPYIIEEPAQLLTLFCYLSGEHEVYRSFLKPGEKDEAAWQVVPIGGDGVGYECTYGESETTHTVASYDVDEDFPSVDDMRTAYYMIKNDIDLANTGDANYTMLLKRFAGLGSYKYPFAGVIVGAKITETSDGTEVVTYPTITLPSNDSTEYTHFGLIEYMQGAVVKDINIKSNDVTVAGSVGGVAAVILGGDNIIDNVTIGISATLRNAPAAGGYVGIIENGSLILRNVKDKNVVNDCEFKLYDDENITVFYTSPSADTTLTADVNMRVGLLVGVVEDGFIVYDNTNEFGEDTEVITLSDMPVTTGRVETLPLVNGFHIINGYSLDVASGTTYTRIALETQTESSTGALTGFDVNIYNTEQLEIMALALNSDSLSIYVDESHSDPELRVSHESGYDYTAKCRKATYEDVGTSGARESADCVFAKAYDDGRETGTSGYLYPYLCYKYMCVTDAGKLKVDSNYSDADRYTRFKTTISQVSGATEDGSCDKYISVLNKADDNVKQYTTNYKLRADSEYVYDLSAYENSFRGFGALYSKTYSDFRANFDGKAHSIEIKMDRNWDANVSITGMFNSLIYDNRDADGDGDALEIINFTLVDSVFQNLLNKEDLSTVDEINKQQGAVCGAATGAVAGEVQGKWDIKDIKFTRTQSADANNSYEGLLLAALNNEEFAREITCGVRGYMNVGGLIGRINVTEAATSYGKEEVHTASNDIEIKRCFVQGIDGTNTGKVNIIGGTNAFAVGGLVGSIGANVNSYGYDSTSTEGRYFYFGNVLFKDCTVENANILAKNSGFLGGYAGTVGYNAGVYCRSVGSVEVKHEKDGYSNTINQVKILSTVYETRDVALDKYSAGGVFGQIEVLAYKPISAFDGMKYRNSEISSENTFSKIQDVTVSNVLICNQSDNTYTNINGAVGYTLQGRTGGLGGLIGYLNCRKMVIENVLVEKATIGFNDFDDEDTANDQYALTHVGGLIGLSSSNGEYSKSTMSFYTNMLKIEGASVTDSVIANKQQQADAGGFIGYLSTEIVTIEDYNTGDAIITNKILGNEISASGTYANAGGVIGQTCTTKYVPPFDYTNSTLVAKKYIKYLDVENNLITAKGTPGDAGGIVGEFTINDGKAYENRLTLEDVNVGVTKNTDVNSSNTIIGTEYVGGLCGYIRGMTYLRYHGYVSVGSESGGNTLIGRVTGGLYGKNELWMNGELREVFDAETEIVEIVNNKIIATSQTNNFTVSGGVAGVRAYDKSTSPYIATYTIRKNVIIATGKTADGYLEDISCAGMYGIVKYSAGPYIQYFDNIVLEDNSIGYFPAYAKQLKYYDAVVDYFTNKEKEGYNLNYTSQDVYLLKWNEAGTDLEYGNWRTFDINESNVGDYSYKIGSYIGNYKDAGMHCVFLNPTLSYSKEVGSIPVVDVASYAYSETVPSSDYGYSYPYDYKYKYHFIYLDDYLSEDDIIDISSKVSGVKPILDESVLMVHSSTTSTNENGETVTTNTYEKDYYFGNIADIVSKYSAVKNATLSDGATDEERITSTYNFLTSKRLDITMGGTGSENLICASTENDDYFSKTYIDPTAGNYNGVPVIEMDGQAAQYIGDYAVAILTNGGGVYPGYSSNTFNNILNISCVNAYIAPDGTIHAIDENAVDVVKNSGHTESSITVTEVDGNENQLSAAGRQFDQVIETESGAKYYTITLLRYTYNSYDYAGNEKKETIYIPVFVTKKVTMNSYLSILSGEEYSLEEASTNGWGNGVVISHDSVYTVYSEFVYDEVREEETFSNLKINKSLKFENESTSGYQSFYVQAGTKYTLVDVQTGEEYYYTVPAGGVCEIPFYEFKDSDGNPYIQRNIGEGITIEKESYNSIGYQDATDETENFENVGLERFFIVVEPSGKDGNNVTYRLSITTEVVDEAGATKEESVRKILSEGIDITQIPGPLISFEGVSKNDTDGLVGEAGVTEISGTISKEGKLTIDGTIRVSLTSPNETDNNRFTSPYWRDKNAGNTIDSANSGKYLEIGVTLIDKDNKEVQWPEGTNVSINGSEQKPLVGSSVVYSYKDNGEQFEFDTLTHDIADGEWYYYNINGGSEETADYQWITKSTGENGEETWYYQVFENNSLINKDLSEFTFNENYVQVSNHCHLEFDFSVADIKDYVGNDYTVKINLYRSSDPNFPLEEIGTTVLDGSIREYYKQISAEGNVDLAAAITPNDLLELGINLYGDTQDTYGISFTNKIDFTNMISTNETAAENDVKECAEKNYMVVYRIYKKTQNTETQKYTYELVDLNVTNSPFTLSDVTTSEATVKIEPIAITDEDGNPTSEYAYVTTKTFTEQEIKANTDGATKYVVTWQMKLTVDGSKIKNEDLANYKVEATYLPYDGTDQPTSDSESTLKDYFIFTIAKLKTDF